MAHSELAGKLAPHSLLENIPKLVSDYYTLTPDVSQPDQAVSFGTSGHRGCASACAFNENHIAAIAQAIVEYRDQQGKIGRAHV